MIKEYENKLKINRSLITISVFSLYNQFMLISLESFKEFGIVEIIIFVLSYFIIISVYKQKSYITEIVKFYYRALFYKLIGYIQIYFYSYNFKYKKEVFILIILGIIMELKYRLIIKSDMEAKKNETAIWFVMSQLAMIEIVILAGIVTAVYFLLFGNYR